MDVVVIGSTIEYNYYGGNDFDSENPQPPVCYAFGDDEDALTPHPDSADKQAAACKGCPQNEFGSAEKGRGKACKNTRRLALVAAPDVDDGDLSKIKLGFMKLNVMSIKGWAAYVKSLNDKYRRPPFAVVTEIEVANDAKSQFRVLFDFKALIPESKIKALIDLYERVKGEIAFPYQPPSTEPKAAKGGAKKKAAKRKY
jgi:hypothetical protein